jgi:hypothetical protein
VESTEAVETKPGPSEGVFLNPRLQILYFGLSRRRDMQPWAEFSTGVKILPGKFCNLRGFGQSSHTISVFRTGRWDIIILCINLMTHIVINFYLLYDVT